MRNFLRIPCEKQKPLTIITMKGLSVCLEHRTVEVLGQPVELTGMEFDILSLLITNQRRVLTYGIIISPIIVWGEIIIDGHNRFRIIEKHPHIDFTTCERNFHDRHEALAWICKNQLGRRNLTFQQKKYLIGKRYESEKASYGGNRNLSHDENGRFTTGSQVGNLGSSQKTCERIANEYGISRNSVIRAETFAKAVDIADEIDPGIRSEILAGKIKPIDKQPTPEKKYTNNSTCEDC